MKQGLDADIKSMSQAEKTMLRYQYVIANTTAAHNDFSRTALTWANQTRILKQNFEQLAGTIGGVFVNAIKPMVIALNTAMGYINSFAKTVANALGKIFGWTYEEGGGGLAQDFGDAADGSEDLEDSTGKTAKNIDKMKKGLRAFDELKTIELPEPKDSSGKGGKDGDGAGAGTGEGIGGNWKPGESIIKRFESEIDTLYKLGKYIGDKLSEAMESINWDSVYKKASNFGSGLASFLNGLISPKLFSSLGKAIAGSINTALEFLDSFGKTFNFSSFGKSIGVGINSALKGINWKTALSAAKKWGKGIAKAINGFVKTTDFSLVGSTVANALNTAIQFALSMGKELNFKKIGLSIADGINGFFKKFKANKLAKTINVWVKGALEAVSTLLKKTDFEMIGKKIGEFLSELDLLDALKGLASVVWEAIKGAFNLLSGIFKSAPLETLLIAAFALLKFTKIGNTIASSLSNALILSISKVLSSPDGIILTIKNGLVGAVDLAKGAFTGLKNIFTNGDFFGSFGSVLTKIKDGLSNVRSNLTGMQKLCITAAAGFTEFNIVSDTFEELTQGNEDFLTGIGKIAGAASLAATGMYLALGPAGLAIAGITGVVAAIKGINSAMKKINAKIVGDAIYDALTSPGGVSVNELTDGVVKSIGNIGEKFSSLSEKSNELDNAEKNIEDIKSQIELVEAELEAGTITAEEAKDKLTKLMDELNKALGTKFETLNSYIVAAFGENGVWKKGFEDAGVDVSDMVGKTLGLTSDLQKRFTEITEELATLDPTSPRYKELQEEMYRIIGQTDSLETALTNFATKINSLDINYDDLIADDGKLDTKAVENAMNSITTAVNDANTEIDAAGLDMQNALTELMNAAKAKGNQEAVDYYGELLEKLPEIIKTQKKNVAEQGKELTDTLQSGLVDRIKQVGEDAYNSWGSLTSAEKGEVPNATAYAQKMINDYINKVINPFSESVETSFGELGLNGAGWSGQAAKDASEAFTNYDWFENFGDNMSSKDFSGVLEGVVSKATKDVKGYTKTKMKAVGKQAPAGMREGVNDKLSLATGAVGNMANKMLSKARETLGVHSPSTKFKEIGGYVVEGMKGGIKDKWSNFSEFWKEKHDSILGRFKNIKGSFLPKGKEIISGIKSGISGQWGGFEKDWAGKKKSIVDKFIGIKETFNTKGNNIVTGLKGGIGSKWGEFNTYWSGRKNSVVDKFKNINTTFNAKGKNIISGIKSGINENWTIFDSDWTKKKDSVVGKFDGVKELFNTSGEDMVSGLEGGIGSKWDGFVKELGDKIKSMVNGIIHGINWVLEKLSVPESKWLKDWDGFATGSNGLPQDTIGIVNDQKGSVYKELIVPPHGKPFIPEGRNVMLPMEKGTKIMPAKQTKDLMQKFNGFPHFAGGIGDFFSGAWAKITEFTGNVWDYLSHPEKILQIAMDKFTDLSGMLEPVLSIAKGAASTLLNGATDFIKKIFDEGMTAKYNPSKGVEQWRGVATKALQMTGQFTETNLKALLYRMNMESSGNPKAINLWDSNAKKGNPSKGLMQVVPTTFAAYAMPGFDKDIWDPLSNILASIRYTLDAYKGSLTAGWLKSGGYAKGIGKINIADLIPQYRAGGFPEQYSLFMAGEQGRAEILGTVGGKTAVAGGEEITGIRKEIRSSSSMEVQLLREQNQLLRAILEKPTLRNDDVFNAAKSIYRREATRRYGDSAAFDPVWG